MEKLIVSLERDGMLCPVGSIQGEKSEASYEPITAQQVRQLSAEGATKSAELVTKSHLSLTGASGTHIVKQSHVRLEAIVANEQLLAASVNLPRLRRVRC